MAARHDMAHVSNEVDLTINQEYAKKYEKKKKAEELSRLKDMYGDVALDYDESSSSSEIEDEDAMGITDKNDLDFLRTLSLLRGKSKKVYKSEVCFFESEEESGTEEREDGDEQKQGSGKPLYLKDYERQRLLERGVKALVSDSESEEEEVDPNRLMTYNEEQERLREDLKSAALATKDSSDNGDLLTLRKKTKGERKEENKDYTKWLKGEKAQMDKKYAKEMKSLKRNWTDPNLDPDEAFLRDYILNRGYLDVKSSKFPTYHDITGGKEEEEEEADSGENADGGGLADTSTDEDEVEEQEQFERVYNFRYEEPGGTEIATYPRTIPHSVRRVDDTRKEKRKAREERKEGEMEKKKEELKRLKKLKREEIMSKLEKIKAITGNPNVGFREEEIEEDFDPKTYDKMMEEAFTEDYYQQEENGEKPEFLGDEEMGGDDDDDDWMNQIEEEWIPDPHHEDPDFNMDADFIPLSTQGGEAGGKQSAILAFRQNKSKKSSKFAEAVASHKPYHEPDEKTYEEYFDEYYKLDFEDIIADLPCRFKYREVKPMTFGLTTEEILGAEDRELNKWVSLKKSIQHRTEEEEKEDASKFRKKGRHRKKKQQILCSLYKQTTGNDATDGTTQANGSLSSPSKGKGSRDHDQQHKFRNNATFGQRKQPFQKRKLQAKRYFSSDSEATPRKVPRLSSSGNGNSSFSGSRSSSRKGSEAAGTSVSDGRLKAYGLKGKGMKAFKWKNKAQ